MAPRRILRKADILEELVATAQALARHGFVVPGQGSLSARLPNRDAVAISSGGARFDRMTYDHLVTIDWEGRVLEGDLQPSKTASLHLTIYRHVPEVGCVCTATPPYATMFAVAGKPVPAAVDDLCEAVGGKVSFADPSSSEREETIVAALAQAPVVLARGVGLIATADEPDSCLTRIIAVEHAARIVWGARLLARGFSNGQAKTRPPG